jgi:hypothetical protein
LAAVLALLALSRFRERGLGEGLLLSAGGWGERLEEEEEEEEEDPPQPLPHAGGAKEKDHLSRLLI